MSITITFTAFDGYDLDARPGRGALLRAATEVVPGLALALAVRIGVRVGTTG